jgi:hypothetical protein
MKARVIGSTGMLRFFQVIQQPQVHRALLASGIASSLVWLSSDILAAMRYDSYDYPLDPISSLSAVDSPVRAMIIPLSILYLVLKISFSFGVWGSANQKRDLRIVAGLLFAFSLTDVASYFFPFYPNEPFGSFTNLMHSILAGGVTVLLILLIIGYGAGAGGKRFRTYSFATLLVMVVMGVLPLISGMKLSTDQIPEWFGVGERINAYGYMLWILVLAIVLLQRRSKIPSNQSIEAKA